MTTDSKVASITVNGTREVLAATDLVALLREWGIGEDDRGIAVAVNGAVVPRADWAATQLSEGDAIEILRARQGG